MTLSDELIEPQQWYRWHDHRSQSRSRLHPTRFHFGDVVVSDVPPVDSLGGTRANDREVADVEAAGPSAFTVVDLCVTFRCRGVVRIEGEDLATAQLADDESLLAFTVRVAAADEGVPRAEIVAQFMIGDFAGLDTADPSAALTDFELRARGEALISQLPFCAPHPETVLGTAALARYLDVSERRLTGAFRNTGNSVMATLRRG